MAEIQSNTLVLNKNTAHDYTLESTYYTYIENRIEQELRINTLISECTILNESGIGLKTKTKRIAALYEAKMSDSIKDKFKKFVEFMKNLFAKFTVNIRKIFQDQKGYLDKYREIITKRKGSSEIQVSYYGNYDKGCQRITKVHISDFKYKELKATLGEKKEKDEAYAAFFNGGTINTFVTGLDGFNYDENVALKDQFKEYFIGGEDGQQSKKMSDMNLQTMFNFCYDYESTIKEFEKDTKALDSSVNKLNAELTKANLAEEKPATESANMLFDKYYIHEARDVDTINKDIEAKEKEIANADKSGVGSANLKVQLNKLKAELREAEKAANTSSAPTGTGGTGGDGKPSNGGDGNTNMEITDNTTGKFSQAAGTNNRNGADQDAANAKEEIKKAAENNETQQLMQRIVNRWQDIMSAIITGKMTACEQISKDYMKMINMHVKSYVGKEAKPGENSSQAGATYQRTQRDKDGKIINNNNNADKGNANGNTSGSAEGT